MKTTILLFFIITCSNFVYAQQCKTKVEIDDFSGETKLYSQPTEVIARNKVAVISRAVFADNYLDPTYEKEVKDSQATLVQKEAKCFLETMVNQE